MTIQDWIKINKLNCKEEDKEVYSIEGFGKFLLLQEKEGKIVDKDFKFLLTTYERKHILFKKIENVVFEFGEKFYYTPVDFLKLVEEKTFSCSLLDFKYLGTYKESYNTKISEKLKEKEFVHLGVHSEYEILNGSHIPEDWVRKCKFLKMKSLGIADLNTLASALSFQLECQKKEIKPIIGETVTVEYKNQERYQLKLYVKNKQGWQNLLRINKIINVDNCEDKHINHKQLLELAKGLILVFNRQSIVNRKSSEIAKKYINTYKKYFDILYYQIDTVRYEGFDNDKKEFEATKQYLENLSDLVEPILINDSYYLDEEEYEIKKILNDLSKTAHPYSKNQHFKTKIEAIEEIEKFFNKEKQYCGLNRLGFFNKIIDNTKKLSDSCNFLIEVGQPKIPAFETKEDKTDLFFDLLEKGFKKKIKGRELNEEEYLERLDVEASLIVKAKLIDYFLIVSNFIKKSKEKGIIIGNARGSVAGSLVAYLVDITEVDPIEHDLMFERFLNEARVLPEYKYEIILENGDKYFINEQRFKELKLKKGIEIKEEILK